jgi:hypothetical protein
MSRGYLCAIWRPTWHCGAWGSIHSRREWTECARRSLATFRLFHPADQVVLVDVDGMLTPGELEAIRPSCVQVVQGADLTDRWVKTGTLWNKVIALQASPFDETCLFDLDFHFTGPMWAVFGISNPLGTLHYPANPRTQNHVNTGLVVCLDKRELAGWEKNRLPPEQRLRGGLHGGGDRDCDEMAMDRAITAGDVRVFLLPDRFGRDQLVWKGRGWAVDYLATNANAYHWQSLKREMAVDTNIATMLESADLCDIGGLCTDG